MERKLLLYLKKNVLLLAFMLASMTSIAASFNYSYLPASGTYTDTSGPDATTRFFSIDYNVEHTDGETDYTNGQICSTLAARDAKDGTLIFIVKKCSGYFLNGNSGKIFVHDSYTGDVYATQWKITDNTTKSVYATVDAYGDFEGSRVFTVLLYTSDLKYRQWGGTITMTGSASILKPTVVQKAPTDIQSSSATFNGIINPNGNDTKYWFEYSQSTSTSIENETSKITIPASAGEKPVSIPVTGLSPATNYSVTLKAENKGGISQSSLITFVTEPDDNNPPTTPYNPTPAHQAAGVNTSGFFRWTSSDPDGDNTTYTLHLGKSRYDMPVYNMGQGNSCNYEDLEYGQEYWWFVEVSDGKNTTVGPSWTFTTRDTDADESRLKITDATYFGTNTLTQGSTYSFYSTIKNEGYDVWKGGIYLKSDGVVIKSWSKTIYGLQTEPITFEYTPTAPQENKVFTLFFQTNDDGNGGIEIPAGNFNNPFTVTIKEKSKYTLPTPDYTTFYADNITSTGFTAHWGKVAGATSYAILVRDASGTYQAPIYKNYGCTTNSVTVTNLQPSTVYYFQIQAINGTETSEWSHSVSYGIRTETRTNDYDLKIANATYFSSDQLVKGESSTFVAKVTNAGNDKWSGAILLMENGESWLFWNKEIGGGKTVTLTGTYTPDKAGTFSPALYYQTNNDSSKKLISGGNYSNPFTITIKSDEQKPLSDGIALYTPIAFNSTILDTNVSHHLVVQLKNTSSVQWHGTIRLYEDDKEINHWSCHPDGNSIISISHEYVPSSEGMHSLSLYYQREGSSVKVLVQSGNYKNPINIEARDLQKEVDGIMLSSPITCSESDVQVDEEVTITAKIINRSGNDWSGTVYLTDNNAVIMDIAVNKLGNDKFNTLICNWTPATVGRHDIGFSYSSNNDPASCVAVSANGYENPFFINVTGKKSSATEAEFVLITRDLAPHEVNSGSVVQYHYRVTDNEGNRLSGITAYFDLSVNSVSKGTYISSPSDDNGIITINLHTDGVNAIAKTGEIAILKCTHLTDSEGQYVALNAPNINDKTIELKVHNGSMFERIEKLTVTMNRGVEGAGSTPIFKCSAGLDFPMRISLKWDEKGNWTQFGIGTEVKASASAKSNDWFTCLELGASGEVGIKSNTDISTSDPKKAALMGMLLFCEGWQTGTSRTTLLAVETLESWFDTDLLTSSIISTSDSYYYGFTLSGSYDLLKKWPDNLKSLAKSYKSPPVSGKVDNALKLGGSGSMKVVPCEIRYDNVKKATTYVESRGLKVKLTGDFKNTINAVLWGTNKSWWRYSDFGAVANAALTITSFFPGVDSNSNGIIGIEESETYSDKSKNHLQSISNTLELTTSNSISTKNLAICKEWSNVDEELAQLSASISGTVKMKLTSTGDYARYLESVSLIPNSNSDIVKAVFPAFKGNFLIADVPSHYNVWKHDAPSSLSRLIVSQPKQYDIKEALKMETQTSSTAGFNVEIPMYKGAFFTWKIKLGLEVGMDNFPSETYYSVEDKSFFPVIIHPTTSITSVVEAITTKISNRISSLFSSKDIQEIDAIAEEIEHKQGKNFKNIEGTQRFSNSRSHSINSISFGSKRHPLLATANMNDICTFTFTINGNNECFDDDTEIAFAHFYPAGSLLAVTEDNDTVFVLSEVVDLTARINSDTIFTAPNGQFYLDTHVGNDDLSPFGFSSAQPFGIYQANEGSDVWHYVGIAGTSLPVDGLGSYIIGTSIKNDVSSPEVTATLDKEKLVVHLNVTDNVGISLSSLCVFVNGEQRTATWIGDSRYELPLKYSDVQGMFTIYVMVDDIAGNSGHLFQMYEYDSALEILEAKTDSNNFVIRVEGNRLLVDNVSPGATLRLFSLDGEMLVQDYANERGEAVISINNILEEVCIVTISDGISKKVMIK